MSDIQGKADSRRMNDDVVYRAHSMMHKAIVQMDPTKLELLEDFEMSEGGHKYAPEHSNVRVIISGKDWSNKRFLIYGCKSSEEAQEHIESIIDLIERIGHTAKIINAPEIKNIAVSGDLGEAQVLEEIAVELQNQGCEVEYEPEQFPAVIIRLASPSVTFLIFSNGKFSIQGLQNPQEIEPQIKRVKELLTCD